MKSRALESSGLVKLTWGNVSGVQRLHHHAVLVRFAGLLDTGLHFHDVAGRQVVVEQPDHEGAIGGQASRRRERPVVQFGHGGQHAFAHFLAHARFLIEHA